MIALVIHSQQTEATYRLDFLWKLQAKGKHTRITIFYYFNEHVWDLIVLAKIVFQYLCKRST